MILSSSCDRCPRLVRSRRRVIWGEHVTAPHRPDDPSSRRARIAFVGEAPAYNEERQGRPFVGLTGTETRNFLWQHGLDTHTYISNVIKCRPPRNRDGSEGDPEPEEIAACRRWMDLEIGYLQPDIVIAAGRFAARALLGTDDFTMDMISGIPFTVPDAPYIVIPMIHPAAGFHRQQDMSAVLRAFATAQRVFKGEEPPRPLPAPADDVIYTHARTADLVRAYLAFHNFPPTCAIDTEDGPDGPGWCLTLSVHPETAVMIKREDAAALAYLSREYITKLHPTVAIHSALHDLPRLRALDVPIPPEQVFDTMVAAYLLQDEPLGLKPLACRIANVKMSSYTDTIAPARKAKALAYLDRVVSQDWPKPEPVLEYRKGMPHVKQPQAIGRKAAGIIRDVKAGKVVKDGLVSPRKRWLQIGEEEGRGIVERELGAMPDGFLADIPFEEALAYACSDADMTLRIMPHLSARLEDEGLEGVMADEMGLLPFIDDMGSFGIPCDADHFRQLSVEYQAEMREIERKITKATGGWCGQLTSHQQVSALLYDEDKLNLSCYLPKKFSKKAGATKTGDDIIAQIEPFAPEVERDEEGKAVTIVTLIRNHREVSKLDTTYASGIVKHITADGRSHPDFRTTNTDTGRLSCADPNWMAMPKRSVKGKGIRNGVEADDGCLILSMDYSQIELRLTAEEANEQSMIDAFKRGIDLHALTAYEMFYEAMPWGEMTDEQIKDTLTRVDKQTQRLPAKTINFGIIYGISAPGLYRNMIVVKGCEHWTINLAQQYIDQYYIIRPGIRGYVDETVAMARRHGKVWDWAGRIRRIPGARLKSEYHRAEAERQACNARIQGGAQSIIKKAMVKLQPVYEGFRAMGYTCSPMIQIHDDIVSMVSVDLLPLLVPVQKEIMETVRPLKAGCRVDVEVGEKWGELRKWGQ
jgi:uracil-DNA glycosylase family 4